MSSYTVHVSGISPTTTEAKLHDFFTFCGKIQSIDFKGSESISDVHFEKPSAVHTALMLNGGTLDGAQLTVSADGVQPEEDREAPHADGSPFAQSDKPRAGIAAEYLAKGYVLSDQILQRAIDLDDKNGISKRFLSYFQSLDSTIGSKALGPDQTVSGKLQSTLNNATDRARILHEQNTSGYTKAAHEYYTKAVSSSFGSKVFSFYTNTSKQVWDIHEEARRIAGSHKNATATPTTGPSEPPKTEAPVAL